LPIIHVVRDEVNTGAWSIYGDIQHTIFQSYNSERANLLWYSTQASMKGSIMILLYPPSHQPQNRKYYSRLTDLSTRNKSNMQAWECEIHVAFWKKVFR
jgi:hypothetical protein